MKTHTKEHGKGVRHQNTNQTSSLENPCDTKPYQVSFEPESHSYTATYLHCINIATPVFPESDGHNDIRRARLSTGVHIGWCTNTNITIDTYFEPLKLFDHCLHHVLEKLGRKARSKGLALGDPVFLLGQEQAFRSSDGPQQLVVRTLFKVPVQ